MKKKLLIVALAVVSAAVLSSCAAQRQAQLNAQLNAQSALLNSVTVSRSPQNSFYDLTYGLSVRVVTTQPKEEMTGYTHHLSGRAFFSGPTVRYVNSMGLLEKSTNTDYNLYITLNRVDVDGYAGNAWVDMSVSLKNNSGNEVFTQRDISATNKNMWNLPKALNEAYTQALEQINWNRIASFLRTEQLPKDEPQKQVQGLGDTALEQTIIRWDVQSRPQGADIFWRVVSKTPEVKSTNNKYLMTTPYEATKSLDIKGLTYQTSGDVRIILRCEKDGYHPQEKEYNVRMVLDQEEISAFFRLVKEE